MTFSLPGGDVLGRLEVAWDGTWTAVPAPGDWSEISDYLMALSIEHGRSNEFEEFSPGVARFTLLNTDRAFDPTEHSYVRRGVPVRYTATYGTVERALWYGFAEEWEQHDSPDGLATCDLPCVDGLSHLANYQLPESVWAYEVANTGPWAWWRLGESTGSTAADGSGNNRAATYRTSPNGASGLLLGSDNGALELDGTREAIIGGDMPALWPVTVALWYKPDRVANTATRYDSLFTIGNARVSANCSMYVNPTLDLGQLVVEMVDTAGHPGQNTVYAYGYQFALSAYPDRISVIVQIGSMEQRSSTQHVRLWVQGIQTWVSTEYFLGWVAAPQPSSMRVGEPWTSPAGRYTGVCPTGVIDEIVVWDHELRTSQISTLAAAGNTAWAGDTPGTRIARVLDLVGWPAYQRSLDPGQTTLQAAKFAGNALDHLRDVARSDAGLLYVDATGVLTYEGRYGRLSRTADVTLSDADSGSVELLTESGEQLLTEDGEVLTFDSSIELNPYTAVLLDRSGSWVRNVVQAQRVDGIAVSDADETSRSTYGPQVLSLTGLQNASDEQVESVAAFYLSMRAEPLTRVSYVTIEPPVNVANLWPHVILRDVSDRVDVYRWPSNTGGTITAQAYIEAVRHESTASPWRWATTWTCSPVPDVSYGDWDTADWDSEVWG